MNDNIRVDLGKGLTNSFFVCDIHGNVRHGCDRAFVLYTAVGRSDITSDSFITSFCQFIHHIVSQLSGNTCYKYFHIVLSIIYLP